MKQSVSGLCPPDLPEAMLVAGQSDAHHRNGFSPGIQPGRKKQTALWQVPHKLDVLSQAPRVLHAPSCPSMHEVSPKPVPAGRHAAYLGLDSSCHRGCSPLLSTRLARATPPACHWRQQEMVHHPDARCNGPGSSHHLQHQPAVLCDLTLETTQVASMPCST